MRKCQYTDLNKYEYCGSATADLLAGTWWMLLHMRRLADVVTSVLLKVWILSEVWLRHLMHI